MPDSSEYQTNECPEINHCSELGCICSYLASFHRLKVSILGTQSPKYLQVKELQTGSP